MHTYDPDSVRVTIAGRQFDSHAAMKARFKELLCTSPARQSTALDIAEWRAARRAKRKKHALQKRWRAAADMKALLELCR